MKKPSGKLQPQKPHSISCRYHLGQMHPGRQTIKSKSMSRTGLTCMRTICLFLSGNSTFIDMLAFMLCVAHRSASWHKSVTWWLLILDIFYSWNVLALCFGWVHCTLLICGKCLLPSGTRLSDGMMQHITSCIVVMQWGFQDTEDDHLNCIVEDYSGMPGHVLHLSDSGRGLIVQAK